MLLDTFNNEPYALIIIAIIVVMVIACSRAVNRDRDSITKTKTDEQILSWSKANIFTKEKASYDAKIKFKDSSAKTKAHYAEIQKYKYKKMLTMVASFFFCFGFICFILYSLYSQKITLYFGIGSLVCTSVILIVFVCLLFRNIDKLAFQAMQTELKKFYASLNDDKYKDYCRQVVAKSDMYKAIIALNQKFVFDYNICANDEFDYDLNSKSKLDNYNYDKAIVDIIDEDIDYYSSLDSVYKKNIKMYNKYLEEYLKLENYESRSSVAEITDMPYELFNYIEKQLFKQSIKKKIEEPTITINIEYTSPSGRNYYNDSQTFSLEEINGIIERREEEIAEYERQEEIKRAKKEEQKKKEKKLRDLTKLEKQIIEREREIALREQEFKKATQGHIYSADQTVRQENAHSSKSKFDSLNELRLQFEMGNISKDEYDKLRRELL